ncbi:hypothetical protein LCGC14_1559550 [marine sediment metagenome]|uniref:Uncharacterized protein n=1 Tax=marine sediment metagenome TaxID=412755 RepID=A0A0F9J8W7_9ZZZZ
MLGYSKLVEDVDALREKLPKLLRLNKISQKYFDEAMPHVLELLRITNVEFEEQPVDAVFSSR